MTKSNQDHSTQSESPLPEIKIDWPSLINQWKSSGISQAAYCEKNDINYKQFVYQNTKQSARARASSKLLPVKITQPNHLPSVQNNFVLHYPNGLKLHIPVNAHPEAIKVLLNCLEERSC